MRKIIYFVALVALIGMAAGQSILTVEVLDEEENRLNSNLAVEQDGQTIAENDSTLEVELADNEEYSLIQETGHVDVTINGFSIDSDFDFRPKIIDKQTPEGADYLTDLDSFYFVNQSLSFSEAEIDTGKEEEPDRIAKCSEFDGFECLQWEVNSTADYIDNSNELGSSGETYTYEVTEFSAYASGDNAPLPKIENLSVFEVEGLENQRSEGELVDQGLNKTFDLRQFNSTEYRFTFDIINNGSEEWVLTSDDQIIHRGLNSSWGVNETDDIYYEIDQVYEGGTFTSQNIEWNTGNGGTVGADATLDASYIVNISQSSTTVYDQEFEADTTENTGDNDEHKLEVLIYGFMEAVLEDPINNTVLQKNREFNLSGYVDCFDGDCGGIDLTARRNDTDAQVEFNGEFFEINSFETDNCEDLLEGERCETEWQVNASGETGSTHLLDFEASSEYPIEDDSTDEAETVIQRILMISLGWEVIDFGLLDPGDREKPAENNTEGYPLTVDEDSNTVEELWLKGSDLQSQEHEDYSIGIGNMTYNDEDDVSTSVNITRDYSRIAKDLLPGTVLDLYYWLDVPQGIYRGEYSGNITFKANATE